MPRRFVCNLSKDELLEIYTQDGMTLRKMCDIVGCKSDITMSKILKSAGIDTNNNRRIAFNKRGGRTDEEFKKYLISEYVDKKRSMSSIAKELNISWVIVSRYLDKYGLQKRTKSEQQSAEGSSNWGGGRHKANNGYIELYMPDYHRHHKPKYVYEHIYIAEITIGRHLEENEVVHHINRDKTDNRPENLMVLTKEEHTKLHSMAKEFGNRKSRKEGD